MPLRLRSKRYFLLALFCLLAFQPLHSSRADKDKEEPSATGSVRVSLADGAVTHAEFEAQLHDDGSTTGQMTFSAFNETARQSMDGTSENGQEPDAKRVEPGSKFYFKASFDCMVITGTQAVMSGSVFESNSKRYVGQRVLLVVQDRGDGLKSASADRLTWGIYNPKPRTWVASDAEVENDTGIATSWLATDGERDDDMGISSEKSELIGCRSFPLSSFSLVKVKNGDGDIKVRP